MTRHIQIGKVQEDGRLDYEYMGAAEFEYGSVQMTRQLLRFGKTKSKILDEVYFKAPTDKTEGVEKLVIIAIDHPTPSGNLLDRAIANFHTCVRNCYEKNAYYRFKEPPRLEYSVGILGSAEFKPRQSVMFSERWGDKNFWIACDWGVYKHRWANGHDEEEAKRNLEEYYRDVENHEDKPPVWVVCRLKDFKHITAGMNFPRLLAPGVEAVSADAIRMFDTVKYRTKDGEMTAKVVGILEKGIRLERDGKRFVVDESCIVQIVKEKKRA